MARIWIVAVLAAAACGGDDRKGEGEECTASSECADGLTCDFGATPPVCRPTQTPVPDAAPVIIDAAAAPHPDAPPGTPDAAPGTPDAPPPPDALVPPPDAPIPDAAPMIDV
jgi:hypothetical protein